ncbi:MAG: hypothetical protein HY909_03885 [Deltaproteobacteria bacterium]|nr:hypothetical protein [Deltaproteobacteria bacterium]
MAPVFTNAVEIATGAYHTCARRGSGEVFCWGYNGFGQLGDGSITGRSSPPMAPVFTNAVEIATGANHTCARRGSGEVFCWGWNGFGQLGDGTPINRSVPTPVRFETSGGGGTML